MDTIRRFIYQSGIWIDPNDSHEKINQLLVEYPGGEWRSPEYLKKHESVELWDQFLQKNKECKEIKLFIKKICLTKNDVSNECDFKNRL